jgi:ABC-type phosphate/phosphonate transport system ATPase subunit
MDVTMIGLQNAGKTSLLRVLAVSIGDQCPVGHTNESSCREESSQLSECKTPCVAVSDASS